MILLKLVSLKPSSKNASSIRVLAEIGKKFGLICTGLCIVLILEGEKKR